MENKDITDFQKSLLKNKYYYANRDQLRIKQKEYYEKNREKYLQRSSKQHLLLKGEYFATLPGEEIKEKKTKGEKKNRITLRASSTHRENCC